jgi:hypothetical protein
MASVIARSLALVDLEKASKQDVELLKRLIVEFKDELDALGVRVDGIDSRLAVLEDEIGGWRISGQFRFDANFGMDENNVENGGWYNDDMLQSGKNDFDLNRYRIFLNKRINDTTTFFARLGKSGRGNNTQIATRWDYYSITTKLGYDVTLTAGSINFDWEGDAGLYANNDAVFGDFDLNAFVFAKDWGIANLQFVLGRLNDDAVYVGGSAWDEYFLLAAKADFDIAEKINAGVMAYYIWGDEDIPIGGIDYSNDLLTAGLYFSYHITPDAALRGLYYYQDQGDGIQTGNEDTASAWRLAFDIGQDTLKFTSVWAEYTQIDNNFINPSGAVTYTFNGASLLANQPGNTNTTKVYGLIANQKWNDKWSTNLGYYAADYDTTGIDDATEWLIGFGYQLNPAVQFQLSYNNIDYGNTATLNNGGRTDDDSQIRFRTFVSF